MPPVKSNDEADVAIVLTMHGEGRTLLPTVHALGRAIAEAVEHGVSVEVVGVFDRADDETRRAWGVALGDVDLAASAPVRVIETAHGDLGLARMAGVEASSAALVGVLDADNLPTSNWIHTAVRVLEDHGGPAIAHPELIVTFDAKRELWPLRSSEEAGFRAGTLLWFNPWDAFAIASREVFDRFPYRELRPGSGFGPEDWTWNSETIAGGVPHLIGAGTALFYRKKPDGSLAVAHDNSLLPRNALLTSKDVAREEIAALAATLVSRETELPDGMLWRMRRSAAVQRVRRSRNVDRAVRGVRYLVRPVQDRRQRQRVGDSPRVQAELRDATLRERWAQAHEIQPRIPFPSEAVLAEYGRWGDGWDEEFVPDRLAYWSAIEALPEAPDIVFFAPWIGTGGADLLATQYMNTVCRLRPDASVVLITTEPRPSTRLDALDPRITVFDLGAFRLHHMLAVRVIATLLTQLRPETIHIVNSTAACHAVEWFSSAVSAHTKVFLSTYVVDKDSDGGQWSFLFHRSRDFFDHVSRIITDNAPLADRAVSLEGVTREKFLVHHQVVDQPYRAHEPAVFSAERPLRLVWVGRFDLQKRLDRLAGIAEMLVQRGVPFSLDVYGEPVLDDDPTLPDSRARLERAGARLHPAYVGGFGRIDPDQLDALIMTSQDEGTPNVVLEAMSSGLPVIVPAVGGLPGLVGEQTGFLVDDPESIEEYVAAVIALITDHSDALVRAANARELVETEYSQARLDQTLEELDGYLPRAPGADIEVGMADTAAADSVRWFATADTRAALANGSAGVLIYTGSNGSSNFGDILQTKNIVRYWRDRSDAPPVLVLPAFAAAAEGRHQQLREWLGVDHIVYLGSDADDDLGSAGERFEPSPASVLLHVVGGGYLNALFGAQHLAAIEAIADAFSVRGILSSGLQIDETVLPALAGLAQRHNLIEIGVRDASSLRLARQAGLPVEDTFDDLIEVFLAWAPAQRSARVPGTVVLHLNTSDYAGGEDARAMWQRVLDDVARKDIRRVIVLNAYADRRREVRDALRSVADLAEDFPFATFEVVDIAQVALREDVRDALPEAMAELATAEFGLTSSYHTALLLTSLGVPTYLTSANSYFAQKADLFRLPELHTFLEDPGAHLLDLSDRIAVRARWIEKLARLG
ncbi:MAG: glycosyltransferase [Actinobacteria bacterium]|nr:glycosyltransferase [Actinomycetota bacterium]